ncbi:hypothetical protein Pelo_7728 [Pelomyxa schiedti]|nr:hypothetical protein Pelo_7728 [Pelomyxa schiedti]
MMWRCDGNVARVPISNFLKGAELRNNLKKPLRCQVRIIPKSWVCTERKFLVSSIPAFHRTLAGRCIVPIASVAEISVSVSRMSASVAEDTFHNNNRSILAIPNLVATIS